MRLSDWLKKIFLRSDWSVPKPTPCTTVTKRTDLIYNAFVKKNILSLAAIIFKITEKLCTCVAVNNIMINVRQHINNSSKNSFHLHFIPSLEKKIITLILR